MERVSKYWPDALVILSIVALFAGVAMTLLTGRSFLLFAGSAPTPIEEQTQTITEPNPVVNNPIVETSSETQIEAVIAEEDMGVAEENSDNNAAVIEETTQASQIEVLTPDIDVEIAETTSTEEAIIEAIVPDLTPAQTEADLSAELNETTIAEVEVPAESSEIIAETAPAGVDLSASITTELSNLSDLEAGRYIQVGAYSSLENSSYQQAAIEELGFSAIHAQDFELIVLLTGPYSNEDLSQALDSLTSANISHYIRQLP